MSNDNDTPESVSEPEVEGVDPDDLANLEVDPDELDEEGAGDGEDGDGVGEDGDDTLAGAEIIDGEAAAESEAPATTDEDRLNLDDDEDKPARKRKTDVDENEFTSADDEEADLATILQEKLRSGEDLPEDEVEVIDTDDVTDGTPLLQPRRPDEEHCQQCFLLVRKSAPKCPVDHDLCPLFPSR
ncbi:MAG: hypothetical protein ACKO61_08610 [Actinomycetota bacterium]